MKFPFHFGSRRPGKSSALLLSAISLVAFIGLAAWFVTSRQRDADNPELLTTTVWKGPYDLAVVARGTDPGSIWEMEDEELLQAVNWQIGELIARGRTAPDLAARP